MEKLEKRVKREWNSNLPLSRLPGEISELFRKEAEVLYSELKENKLEVTLAAAPELWKDRNKIRVVVNHPPQWFSELYLTLNRSREDTLRALGNIKTLKDKEFKEKKSKKHQYYRLHFVLRDFIFERLTEGYEIKDEVYGKFFISPDNRVRKYFGMKPFKEEDYPR